MTYLFACCVVANALLVLVLVAQSRSRVFGRLAGSAVNPLFIFCLLSVVFNIDFIVVWNSPALDFVEQPPPVSQQTILEAYIIYTFLFIGAVLGFVAAHGLWRRRSHNTRNHVAVSHEPAAAGSAQILFGVILAFSIPTVSWFGVDANVENLSYQVIGRQTTMLGLAPWLILPAAALFVACRPRPFSATGVSMLGAALAVFAMSPGARGSVLLVLLIAAVGYAYSKRISVLWYAAVVPVTMLFLAVSAYVFREAQRYESFYDYITSNGGVINLFFGGEQVSFAKMFVAVYQMAPSLPRAPFESIVALLVLPIPRSVFTMKPFGASAAFTQHISPLRWENTRSELLITGYGDVYWQFGALGAFVAMFVLSGVWLWACLQATRGSRQTLVLWTPLLTWFMFIFVRGDLFNIGLLLWPTMVVLALHVVLRHVLTGLGRQTAPAGAWTHGALSPDAPAARGRTADGRSTLSGRRL